MKYITIFVCLCIAFAAVPDLAAQQGGYKIVVHPSNPGSSVGKTELKRIFLKQRTKWSSGEKAQPVDQKNRDVYSW